jgi:nucleoid DNA-binding protein
MIDIQNSIAEFLELNHKVNFPGFGILTYTYYPAEILRFTKRILPPKYRIEFIQDQNDSNEDFVKFLCKKYSIEYDEAQSLLQNFIQKLKDELFSAEKFYIPYVGTFYYSSKDQRIRFEEDKDSKLLGFNFGLKDIAIPTTEEVKETPHINATSYIDSSKVEDKPVTTLTEKESTSHTTPKFVKVGLIIAAAILIFFFVATYFISDRGFSFSDSGKKVSDWIENKFSKAKLSPQKIGESRELNREALIYSENKIIKDTSSTVAENKDTASISSMTSANTISSEQKHMVYYIIAGSYKNRENAEQFVIQLKKQGFDKARLLPNDTLYRVAIASFNNRQHAVDEFVKISTTNPELKLWFYSRYE